MGYGLNEVRWNVIIEVDKATREEVSWVIMSWGSANQYCYNNKMGSTKWTYHKEQNFASNYFVFWKFYFSLRASYKDLIWCTNQPNVHIHTFRKCCIKKWTYHKERRFATKFLIFLRLWDVKMKISTDFHICIF